MTSEKEVQDILRQKILEIRKTFIDYLGSAIHENIIETIQKHDYNKFIFEPDLDDIKQDACFISAKIPEEITYYNNVGRALEKLNNKITMTIHEFFAEAKNENMQICFVSTGDQSPFMYKETNSKKIISTLILGGAMYTQSELCICMYYIYKPMGRFKES